MKHDLLAPGDQGIIRKIRDHTAIDASLFWEVKPAQFRIGIPDLRPAGQAIGFLARERRVRSEA